MGGLVVGRCAIGPVRPLRVQERAREQRHTHQLVSPRAQNVPVRLAPFVAGESWTSNPPTEAVGRKPR